MALWSSFARGSDIGRPSEIQSVVDLVRQNWNLARKAISDIVFPNGPADSQQIMTDALRELGTPEIMARGLAFQAALDITDKLPEVKAPTLVVHRRGDRSRPSRAGRNVALLIPGARFLALDGDISAEMEGDTSYLDLVRQFLDEGREQESRATADAPSAGDTHTILFTDMEGSTTLADQLGDAGAQEVRRAHNQIVRAALSANGGNEIKHTGDGIMASFATASSALDAAIAIQRGVAAHKEEQPDSPLGVYVGLNAGEPIAEEGDLFGTSINLAARICDRAEAGQILASNVVRELAAGKQFLFADLGETELRGFEDPVKLWELRWE